MTENEPFFSIVTSVYNRSHIIVRTLESIRIQQHITYEVILVDDCSSDDSVDVIRNYISEYDLPWQVVTSDINRGYLSAVNKGVSHSKGGFVIPMDSDDYFPNSNTCHEMMNIILAHPSQELFMFRCITEDGDKLSNNPEFNGVLSFKDYFLKKVSGEYLPVPSLKSFTETPFNEELRLGSGLTWRKITEKAGSVFISSLVVRIYDNTGDDRLSNRGKAYVENMLKYALTDLRTNFHNYLKYDISGGLRVLKRIVSLKKQHFKLNQKKYI
ncbi:MAG: glycosyltransferase involved in cell wall biosynthesis [Cyclobacteriaceae bacterium]|jgi:glycosyltransferase involved in cell wall biosynthesis